MEYDDLESKIAEILAPDKFMTPNYSLLRSKTFWTIVFNFVFTGYSAISGSLPPTVTVIISGLLSILAATFHLSTGQSQSGSN